MAVYAALNSGNFTSPSTWLTIEPGSYLDSMVTFTSITPTVASSPAFTTTTAGTLCAIGIKIYTTTTTPTTVLMRLSSSTLGVVASATIPNTAFTAGITTAPYGWIVGYLDIPRNLPAASYVLNLSANATAGVIAYVSATQNWSRMLVLTASAATKPVSGDILHVVGNSSSIGITTPVVTMDNTDQNTYDLQVGQNGTVSFSANGSTYLRLSGTNPTYSSTIWTGGTLNIGTINTPILSSYTAVLEFAPAAATNVGLNVFGNFNTYGALKTQYVLLSTNANTGVSTLTATSTPIGWNTGDQIFITPTSQTYTQYESATLASNVTTSVLSTASTLIYPHSAGTLGTLFIDCEVANITKNVKVRGSSNTAANAGFIYGAANATINCFNTEFYNLGSVTTNKYGIVLASNTANKMIISDSSVYNTFGHSIYTITTTGSISAIRNNLYNNQAAGALHHIYIAGGTTGVHIVSSNVICNGSTTGYGINMGDLGSIYNSNRVSGCSIGMFAIEANDINSISNNIVHSNQTGGMAITTAVASVTYGGAISNCKFFRNGNAANTYGISLNCNTTSSTLFETLSVSNCTFFGNGNSGILQGHNILVNVSTSGKITLDNVISTADPLYPIYYDITVTNSVNGLQFTANNSTFTAGADGTLNLGTSIGASFSFNKCIHNAYYVPGVNGYTNLVDNDNSYISFTYFNNFNNIPSYAYFTNRGYIISDSTRLVTAAEWLIGNAPTKNKKFKSSSRFVCVNAGDTVTASVDYQIAGYPASFNSMDLVVKANPSIGINYDTILATALSGDFAYADLTWHSLIGTSPIVTNDGVIEFAVQLESGGNATPQMYIGDWKFS